MDECTDRDLSPNVGSQMVAPAYQVERPPGRHIREAQVSSPADLRCGRGEAFGELTLLLPNNQMEMLETAASRRGLTVGQLLRRLIRNCLEGRDDARLQGAPAILNATVDGWNMGFFRGHTDGQR